jgi:TolB-like protein
MTEVQNPKQYDLEKSRPFLRLIDTSNKAAYKNERVELTQEATELRIRQLPDGSILVKSEKINTTAKF